MKKFLLLPCAAFMVATTACNSDSSEATMQFSIPAYNIITSLDNGETYVTPNTYSFDLNLNKETGIVGTDNLVINNSTVGFKSSEIPYITNGWDVTFKNFQANVGGNLSWNINDANFLATSLYYYNQTYVPGYTNTPSADRILFAQYKLGDQYQVRTFFPDLLFIGETTTTFPGADGLQSFSTDKISYRVCIDASNKKADVLMYDAKFSNNPNEPDKTAVIITGLDIEFNGNGYTISGTDITPDLVEGTSTTPYPAFVFNEFNFATTSQDLTKCSISYKVAGVFTGEFTGSCIHEFE